MCDGSGRGKWPVLGVKVPRTLSKDQGIHVGVEAPCLLRMISKLAGKEGSVSACPLNEDSTA